MSIEFNPIPGQADIINSMAESNEGLSPKRPSKKQKAESSASSASRQRIERLTGVRESLGQQSQLQFGTLFSDEENNVKVFRPEDGNVVITGSGQKNPDLFSANRVNSLLEQAGVDMRLDFPKNWEKLSFAKKNEWLRDKGVRLMPEIAGGAMGPDAGGGPPEPPGSVEVAERRPENYIFDIREVIARLKIRTRQGMASGTEDYQQDPIYIRDRAELNNFITRFETSLTNREFAFVYDFVSILDEVIDSAEHYEPPLPGVDDEPGRPAIDIITDFLPNYERFKREMLVLDNDFQEKFDGMPDKIRKELLTDLELALGTKIQSILSGWDNPENVRNYIFGGIYQEFDRDGNVLGERFSRGLVGNISRNVEASKHMGLEGLREWRAIKDIYGGHERIAIELLTRPPQRWQEVPVRVSEIYRAIERQNLPVETLQNYIQKALHMLDTIQGETPEGRLMINDLAEELKAFQAIQSLKITAERSAMNPESLEKVVKDQFNEETWRLFLRRFAFDNRRRAFLTETGVGINLFDEAWKVYMTQLQDEKKDMVLVEYLTMVDIKNSFSGGRDSRLRTVESRINEENAKWGRRLDLSEKWQKMEDLRTMLLSEGAVGEVKLLMAKLEEVGIREKEGELSPEDLQKLKEALEKDNKLVKDDGEAFELDIGWEKSRLEHFRFKTDQQVEDEIRGLIKSHGSFTNEADINGRVDGWEKAALSSANKVVSTWGGKDVGSMKKVIGQWYKNNTLMGAFGKDERGGDRLLKKRVEMRGNIIQSLESKGIKIKGDDRKTGEILADLESKGFMEGLEENTYRITWMNYMQGLDVIRIYGTHFRTNKLSRYPQAIVFNELSANINGRMIHHYSDFLVDEERGRTYEEDEINGVIMEFLPGFYNNMLPQNRTDVRDAKFFLTKAQDAEVDKRALRFMKANNFIPGEEYREQLDREAREAAVKEDRDPYFAGYIGWARSAVIAEMIDGGELGETISFADKNFSEIAANNFSPYHETDKRDDQRATAIMFSRGNWQEYAKNPTTENFVRVNDSKEAFYSGRNVRAWVWGFIATKMHYEIAHHHWKRLKLREDNMTASQGEGLVDGMVENGALRAQQGEVIKSELMGMAIKGIDSIPGGKQLNRILGSKYGRWTRQFSEFLGKGFVTTVKDPGYWWRLIWDFLRRTFGITVSK